MILENHLINFGRENCEKILTKKRRGVGENNSFEQKVYLNFRVMLLYVLTLCLKLKQLFGVSIPLSNSIVLEARKGQIPSLRRSKATIRSLHGPLEPGELG